jgi:hypothetical protein
MSQAGFDGDLEAALLRPTENAMQVRNFLGVIRELRTPAVQGLQVPHARGAPVTRRSSVR